MFPTRCNITQFIYFWKTAVHVLGGISTHHHEHTQLFYSIWYLLNRYCYLPLLWKCWNWLECGVGIVLICSSEVVDVSQQPPKNRTKKFPHHIQTSSNSSTIAAGSINVFTSTIHCKYSCALLMMGGDTTRSM